MAKTFYFYDLETSGFHPDTSRIMQFGGQRTDLDLQPIGNPHNILIKLSPDTLPDPQAVMVTGITPQKVNSEGVSELEFLDIFNKEVAIQDTIFVGFNNIRFDDEFIRFLNYRNFYDAYEWEWQDGRGRWDLLDLVRMTRALRPAGIQWPFDSSGSPTNRLELLTAVNNLSHLQAHDAVGDVMASIALARLIKSKQPKIFEYLFTMRTKQKVADIVDSNKPFVYTSGRYPSEFEHTSIAIKLANHPKYQMALVFDLRHDPTEFIGMPPELLAECWYRKKEDKGLRLPVKKLKYNTCPAVAPLNVLDDSAKERLNLDLELIENHHKILTKSLSFVDNIIKASEILDKQQQTRLFSEKKNVDSQLYEGFCDDNDRQIMRAIRVAKPQELLDFASSLHDSRLKTLLPLFKARNYPKSLTVEEQLDWDKHCNQLLIEGNESSVISKFFASIEELKTVYSGNPEKLYLLTELELYGQSLIPVAY